jgi:hypothetical protein
VKLFERENNLSLANKYYRKSALSTVATELGVAARTSMVRKFFDVYPPTSSSSVLDVGVTSERDPTANFLEKLYPYPEKLTCAGMQNASWLTQDYPGTSFVQLEPGKPLPFKDQEFDLAYSNAVIEHAGNRSSQRAFVSELMRVSRHFFLTTPHRWVPVEMHTHLPFLHYLPQKVFRQLLRLKGETFYAEEANLNLLSSNELLNLFSNKTIVTISHIWSCGFPSNILAYGPSAWSHEGQLDD